MLKDFLDESMIPDEKIKEFREQTYTRQENFEGVSEFKRILNYFVSYEYRENLIENVANKDEAKTFWSAKKGQDAIPDNVKEVEQLLMQRFYQLKNQNDRTRLLSALKMQNNEKILPLNTSIL